jgi:hypothetical protein
LFRWALRKGIDKFKRERPFQGVRWLTELKRMLVAPDFHQLEPNDELAGTGQPIQARRLGKCRQRNGFAGLRRRPDARLKTATEAAGKEKAT